jgi:plasmid stability protein
MPTLYVRNVPADTYDALRARAEGRGSTLGAEAIRLLRRALRTDCAGVRELLDEIEANRPIARAGSPSAAEPIRRDRDAR